MKKRTDTKTKVVIEEYTDQIVVPSTRAKGGLGIKTVHSFYVKEKGIMGISIKTGFASQEDAIRFINDNHDKYEIFN